MERKLIQFAKVHGYLIGTIMMCSGFRLATLKFPFERDPSAYFAIWVILSVFIVFGVIVEHPRFLKWLKRLYAGLTIVGVMLLMSEPQPEHTLDSVLSAPWLCLLSIVTLYGFGVLHFLQQIFAALHKKRDRATIVMTTFVYGSQPASGVPEQIQQQQQQQQTEQPEQQPEQSQPVLPPSYETAVLMPDSTEQPKEFPKWT